MAAQMSREPVSLSAAWFVLDGITVTYRGRRAVVACAVRSEVCSGLAVGGGFVVIRWLVVWCFEEGCLRRVGPALIF